MRISHILNEILELQDIINIIQCLENPGRNKWEFKSQYWKCWCKTHGYLLPAPYFFRVWFRCFNTYHGNLTGFKVNLCMENSDTFGARIISTAISVSYAWPPLLFYCFKSDVPLWNYIKNINFNLKIMILYNSGRMCAL